MAVNKGEIGIYGVLRRDGGDNILARTDQVQDAKANKTQEQLNLEALNKAAIAAAHIANTENPHSVNKSQVGLGNVSNDALVKRSEMGKPLGVATLDGLGRVPSALLPSYVDDVLEYDTKDEFPKYGETGKIYVSLDTNLTYRWGGTEYVEISKSLALGETSSTAYAGNKGKDTTDKLNTHLENYNNPHQVTKALIGLGNVDNTSDLNKPISTAQQTALNKKVDKTYLDEQLETKADKTDVDEQRISYVSPCFADCTETHEAKLKSIILAASIIPSKAIFSITLKIANNLTLLNQSPVYMHLADSSGNVIGVSQNAVKQVQNKGKYVTWFFDSVINTTGASFIIKLYTTDSASNANDSNFVGIIAHVSKNGGIPGFGVTSDDGIFHTDWTPAIGINVVNLAAIYPQIKELQKYRMAYATSELPDISTTGHKANINEIRINQNTMGISLVSSVSIMVASDNAYSGELYLKVHDIDGNLVATSNNSVNLSYHLGAYVTWYFTPFLLTDDAIYRFAAWDNYNFKQVMRIHVASGKNEGVTCFDQNDSPHTDYCPALGMNISAIFANDLYKNIEDSNNKTKDTTDKLNTHLENYNNPHQVTKALIGLGNVDNTSDLEKPISNAVQAALDEKISELYLGWRHYPINNSNLYNVILFNLEYYEAINSLCITDPNRETFTNCELPLAKANVDGLFSKTDKSKLDNIESGALVNTITGIKGDSESVYRTGNVNITKDNIGLGNVTNEAQIPLSQKGAVSGVATLGTDGKVPSSLLPSYVDDVLEYTNKATFPTTGETGKIYVDTSTNKTYRWSGTTYVEISTSLALGETSSTAYAGDKGKALATLVSALENTVKNIPDITLINIDLMAESAADGTGVTIAFKKYDRTSSAESSVSTKIPAATSSSAGVMSKADKTKLDNIAVGAEVNQNAFSKVVVGSTIIEADNKTDSLTLVAGSNVTITPDATNDKITIASKDTTYGVATTSANGLMSAADKSKLDGIVIATDAEINTIFAESR